MSSYTTILIGSGISALGAARSLVDDHGVDPDQILILEAENYIGGRIKQADKFIPGVEVELGAEILHGGETSVALLAKKLNQPVEQFFCWSQGDGGPSEEPVNGGFGLYFVKREDGTHRVFRYDSKDEDFVQAHEVLENIYALNKNTSSNKSFLQLLEEEGVSSDMIRLLDAGYANTMCSSNERLSLEQLINWERFWEIEQEIECEARFSNSYGCIIKHLADGLTIKTNHAVCTIDWNHRTRGERFVKVTCSNGSSYVAKTLVVSSSPVILNSGKMKFVPQLPSFKTRALQSIDMRKAMKIMLKFKEPCWPPNLHGMIVAGCDVPEIWFRNVSKKIGPDADATCYCTGFITANYADKMVLRSEEEMYDIFLKQLTEVFATLEPEHMMPTPGEAEQGEHIKATLPSPRDVFVGGMVHIWDENHHPFIGGGYHSPRVGCDTDYAVKLAKPLEDVVFFCGEATNTEAGTTTHSALDTGRRAAREVSLALRLNNGLLKNGRAMTAQAASSTSKL